MITLRFDWENPASINRAPVSIQTTLHLSTIAIVHQVGGVEGTVTSVNNVPPVNGNVAITAADVGADAAGAAQAVHDEVLPLIDAKADAASVILALSEKVDKIAPITAKTVGSATKIPVLTHNEQGQIIVSGEVDAAGGGGGSGPTVGNETGQVPAVNGGLLVRAGFDGSRVIGLSSNNYAINSALGNNVVIGTSTTFQEASSAGTAAFDNIAIGHSALNAASGSYQNVAIGTLSLRQISGGFQNSNNNIGVGYLAGGNLTTARDNTIIGNESSRSSSNMTYCTTIGSNTLPSNSATLTNVTAIGYQADVTGSNQVQLGNSATTVYAYGAIQARSDMHDKSDILPCDLGLDFINALKPVKWKWDYREDYLNELFPLPVPPLAPNPAIYPTDAHYEAAVELFNIDYDQWRLEHSAIITQRLAWWSNPVKDGSKTRQRYHYGLGAQHVQATLASLGIDWAGFQNHAVAGGKDTLTIGYIELIAPMLKAIQELNAELIRLKNQINK